MNIWVVVVLLGVVVFFNRCGKNVCINTEEQHSKQ